MYMPVCGRRVYNLVKVFRYTDDLYKTVYFRYPVKTAGWDDESPPPRGVNDEKLENNIARAKAQVFALAVCNPWEWFSTYTIDPSKFDRYNLHEYHRSLSHFLRNLCRKGANVKYLNIPETHANGAWHEHGFLHGVPVEWLRPFTLDERLPPHIRKKLLMGETVYDWPEYRERFGFVDLEPIRSPARAGNYCSKYITKDLGRCVKQLGAHMYYASKGLQLPVCEKKGTLRDDRVQWLYQNDYVSVRWDSAGTLPSTLNSIALDDEGVNMGHQLDTQIVTI